jgi:hypothetical protein
MTWRSDDPEQDEETIKRLAKLAVDFADVNGLGPDVLHGAGPADPASLIGVIREAFFVGRAAGARAVAAMASGSAIPTTPIDGPWVVAWVGPPKRVVN